jgi:hypothetical protein
MYGDIGMSQPDAHPSVPANQDPRPVPRGAGPMSTQDVALCRMGSPSAFVTPLNVGRSSAQSESSFVTATAEHFSAPLLFWWWFARWLSHLASSWEVSSPLPVVAEEGEDQMRRPRHSHALAAGAVALCVGALMALPNMASAWASGSPGPIRVLRHIPPTPRFDVGVQSSVTAAEAAIAPASTSFTQFKATVTDGTQTFTYIMAGRNPAIKVTNAATTIKTFVVPVEIKFSNGDTWDPTVADSCDSGASALIRTQNSPIFVSHSWTWGGTSIGTGQVTTAFQRAEFWKYAQPTGINPSYGVNLAMTTMAKVIINVPNADAAFFTGVSCGNGLLGDVSISWLDSYLQKTLIPSLKSKGVNATTLPIFVLHNVVEYLGTNPSNCCVLGYHNAFKPTTGPVQTYGLSIYDNSGAFSGISDISALSHEVAEWVNDPYTHNATKPWGHIGQVSGCQSNLEVGDPLSGTTFSDTVGGFTYHPQELAFFSWFYHQSPSIGVHGWYSDQGTFVAPAAACA